MPQPNPTHSHAGRVVLDFYDNGEGRLYPLITFDPIGRVNAQTIDMHLGAIYQEVGRAQSATRNGQPIPTPPRLARRAAA